MIEINLTITGEVDEKTFENIEEHVEVEILSTWREKYLKKHFQPGAKEKYDYRPRQESYLRQKERKKRFGKIPYGRDVDLAFSGASLETLQQGGTITAKPGEATLTLPAPWYFTILVGNDPDKSAEVTKVTDEEDRELAYDFEESLQEKLDGVASKS